MTWDMPETCKICGTKMRNLGIGFRALWHCDRCEDRFSAVENRTASEETKPLFEEWWKGLAVGDRFLHRKPGCIPYVYTVGEVNRDLHFFSWEDSEQYMCDARDLFERLTTHNDLGDFTPIPRDASRAALAVQGSGASLPPLHRLDGTFALEEYAEEAKEARAQAPAHGNPYAQIPQPQESALPDTSSTPNLQSGLELKVEARLLSGAPRVTLYFHNGKRWSIE